MHMVLLVSQLPRPHSYAPPSFGQALSICRTLHKAKRAKMARALYRAARKSDRKVDERPRINKIWADHADLHSVLKYLSR